MPSPLLYEINTRCWLRDLSASSGRPITLREVPDSELETWCSLGLTHIWVMGVWTSGPGAREQALTEPSQRQVYSKVLPDWCEEDVAGSPYAIADYNVPVSLGGEDGLRDFRKRLNSCGLKLVLDFVPNHLGIDHPWIAEKPWLFVRSSSPLAGSFQRQTVEGPFWFAYGKDPYFSPWTDTVQLDYRISETRKQMMGVLASIAERCDGVRCDMAMLLLNDVIAKTWERIPAMESEHGSPILSPSDEFWPAAISSIKKTHPNFQLLAECYWGLESKLQEFGFDYTYDKELYDRLVAKDAPGAQRHLFNKTPESLAASAHFLENHDEPRAASTLSVAAHKAAAVIILGLPGMRFLHEGQLSGVTRKYPVQLIRRFGEPENAELADFYRHVISILNQSAIGNGKPRLIRPRAAWQENPTAENFVIILWQSKSGEFDLVVVNYASHQAQCYAPLEGVDFPAIEWHVINRLNGKEFRHSVKDGQGLELYFDLAAYEAQLLHFQKIG